MCQTKCKLLRPIYRTWHHKASARTRLLVAGQPTSECPGRLTSAPTTDRSSSPTPCTNGSRLSVPVEQFSLKVTFHLDHSAGAYQQNNVIFTSSAPHLGAS